MELEVAVALIKDDWRSDWPRIAISYLVQRILPVLVVCDQVVSLAVFGVDQVHELLHLDIHDDLVVIALLGSPVSHIDSRGVCLSAVDVFELIETGSGCMSH